MKKNKKEKPKEEKWYTYPEMILVKDRPLVEPKGKLVIVNGLALRQK